MDSKQFRHTVVNIEGTDAQRHLGADRSSQNDNMWQLYKALFFRRDSGEFKCSRQSYFRHRKSEETLSPVAIFTDNRLLDSYPKCQLQSLKTEPTFFVPFVFFFSLAVPFSDRKCKVKYLLCRCVLELVIWGLFSLMVRESWILPEDSALLVCFAIWCAQSFSLLSSHGGVCIWKDLSVACQKSARGGVESPVCCCALLQQKLWSFCADVRTNW